MFRHHIRRSQCKCRHGRLPMYYRYPGKIPGLPAAADLSIPLYRYQADRLRSDARCFGRRKVADIPGTVESGWTVAAPYIWCSQIFLRLLNQGGSIPGCASDRTRNRCSLAGEIEIGIVILVFILEFNMQGCCGYISAGTDFADHITDADSLSL